VHATTTKIPTSETEVTVALHPEDGGQQGLTNRRYLTTSLHGVTTHKNSTGIFTAVKTANLGRKFLIYYNLIDQFLLFIGHYYT